MNGLNECFTSYRYLKYLMKQNFNFYSCCVFICSEVSLDENTYSTNFLFKVFVLVPVGCILFQHGSLSIEKLVFVCLFHLQKEDVESALRTSNMNLEDAIELLNQGRLNVETWRRHEDHSPFDLPSSHPGAGFPGQRFNPVPQQMSFAPPVRYFIFK